MLYRIVRPIVTFLFKLLYRPVIVNKENIPVKGRVVLAGNHTNILDCLLLISSTKRVIHFLAKDELIKGFKGIVFKNMEIIPVNRRIHDKGALREAINVLNKDEVIGIFPEGTINRGDDLILPFKIGAVKMAYETNSRIIPFVITGKYKLFRREIRITFYDSINVFNNLDDENDKLMNIIKGELAK